MTSDSQGVPGSLHERVRRFVSRPWREKVQRVRLRWVEKFPGVPLPMRLPSGVWWLARNDHVSRPLIQGNFESAESSFIRKFLQPGMTMLDIGAHHGFYTLHASSIVGDAGRVYAFEPSPRERKALLRHVRLNGCKNVRVQALALGAEKKEAELHVVEGSQTGCNSLRPPVVLSGTSSVPVRVMPLDDWLTEQKIGQVDFIKLDVEGGELEVLKGAEALLERRPRPVILAEVQDIRTRAWGYEAKDVIEHLRGKEYEWFSIAEDGSVTALDISANEFDGNFVAFPQERGKATEEGC
jgi:FkbM family methyltransferase